MKIVSLIASVGAAALARAALINYHRWTQRRDRLVSRAVNRNARWLVEEMNTCEYGEEVFDGLDEGSEGPAHTAAAQAEPSRLISFGDVIDVNEDGIILADEDSRMGDAPAGRARVVGSAASRAVRRTRAKYPRCAVITAHHVKSQMGPVKRTEANRLVAARIARDYLKDRGVRPTHMNQIIPIALALVFTPTEADILEQQLMGSTAFVEADEDHTATYHSRGSGLVGWLLGTKRARKFAQ